MAANSGAEKPIAVTLASGSSPSAATVRVCEMAWDSPRATWAPGLRVRNTETPCRGSSRLQQKNSAIDERKNMTSPTG